MSAIAAWLDSLGLSRYAEVFAKHDIDVDVLPELTDEHLKELGISLGHRLKLLKAIAELPSQQRQDLPPPVTSAAERRQLTVLFCDLVGSTALSTTLDPEDLSAVIRAYQNAAAGEIGRFAGHIARFMGDGVLAYFGWPQAHEDEAERAVRAGLRITAAVAELRTPAGVPLAARIGIATGQVVVGELVGEGPAREETVVGETPNLAARLQALAQPCTVVIPENTRQLLGTAFELEPLGPQMLKGIPVPVVVYTVLSERQLESRFEAHQNGSLLPLIGRDQELALMLERWRQAQSNQGQVILLSGEAGIGKSRLTRALMDAVARTSPARITYQCSPYHSDSAFYPAVRELTRVAGFVPGDSPETKLDKLEALLARAVGDTSASAPLLASLLGLAGDARYGPLDLSAQQQRVRTLQVLLDRLINLAHRQPVLFVIEDAHWIDPTTLELIELCLDEITAARVLLLITARPTFAHSFGGHPLLTRLSLNRLGRESITAIIDRLSGGKILPDELLDLIAARTDGVPLFVEELTKAIIETGRLRETEDTYVLDGPLKTLAIPATLHDSLMARLDRLQPLKEVAQFAACLGREFDYRLLASVSPLIESELIEALDGLVAAELIFRRGAPPEARYLFKHALVRDAAYQSLLKSTRLQLHARILDVLETRFIETPVEILAHHAVQGQLWDKAVDYLSLAGHEAMARSAHREAASHLKQALHALEQLPEIREFIEKGIDIRLDLRNCLVPVGEPGAALEYVHQAAKLAEALGDALRQARAACYECILLFHIGKARQALAAGRQAVARAETLADLSLQIPSYFFLGQVHFSLANYRQAIELCERAVAPLEGERRYENYGLPFLPATQPRAWAALCLAELGDFTLGIAYANEAIQIADAADHPFSQLACYWGLGNLYLRQGGLKKSLALLEQSLALCQTWELGIWFSPTASSLGSAYALSDRGPEAIELLERAAGRMLPGRSVYWHVQCLSALGEACLLVGRSQDAREHAARALALSRERQERGNEAWVLRLLGEIASRCERPDFAQAQDHYRKALAIAEELGMRPLAAHCRFGLGAVHKRLGKFEQARTHLAAAIEQYRAMDMGFWLSRADQLLLESS